MSDENENCPFCKSVIAPGASVCAACGAYKGTQADRGIFGRFMIWANTIGVLLIAWLVAVPYWIWHHLSGKYELWTQTLEYRNAATNWRGLPLSELPYKLLLNSINWERVAIALVLLVAGWWVHKAARWIWIKLFGRLNDPVWFR
jgi:hypothetical protein